MYTSFLYSITTKHVHICEWLQFQIIKIHVTRQTIEFWTQFSVKDCMPFHGSLVSVGNVYLTVMILGHANIIVFFFISTLKGKSILIIIKNCYEKEINLSVLVKKNAKENLLTRFIWNRHKKTSYKVFFLSLYPLFFFTFKLVIMSLN